MNESIRAIRDVEMALRAGTIRVDGSDAPLLPPEPSEIWDYAERLAGAADALEKRLSALNGEIDFKDNHYAAQIAELNAIISDLQNYAVQVAETHWMCKHCGTEIDKPEVK